MSTLYEPLLLPAGSKSIRVIDIDASSSQASPNDENALWGELRVIDLDEDPDFTALSYVWGAYAPVPHVLKCGKFEIKITSNCFSALVHLRRKLGRCTIWVDAICINQDDTAEKSRQIPLMGDIYSKANTVYIWLGEGSEQTDRAMTYMSRGGLGGLFESTENSKFQPFKAMWYLWISAWNPTDHPLPLRHTSRLRMRRYGSFATFGDLEALLSKDWINRLWTYQEMLLASNPIIVCGDYHVSWSQFSRALLLLDFTTFYSSRDLSETWSNVALSREKLQESRLPEPLRSNFEVSSLKEYREFLDRVKLCEYRYLIPFKLLEVAVAAAVVVGVSFMVERFGGSSNKDGHRNSALIISFGITIFLVVCTIIFKHRGRLTERSTERFGLYDDTVSGLYTRTATNPKDMAFGMWSILKENGVHDLPMPDYTVDTGTLYWILAKSMIQASQRLDTIQLASLKSCSGQPSWVPDWSAALTRKEWDKEIKMFDWFKNIRTPDSWASLVDITTNIEGSAKPQNLFVKMNPTKSILTVRAHHIGDISRCFRFNTTGLDFAESEREAHLGNIVTMRDWLVSGNPKRASISESEYRPQGELLYAVVRAPEMVSKGNKFRQFRKVIEIYGKNHKSPTQIISLMLKQDLFCFHTALCNFLATLKGVWFQAQLPKLPDKLLLGSCSPDVLVDDQIVCIEGVSRPIIVRRVLQERKNRVEIVSPVAFHESEGQSHLKLEQSGVEYEIL